MLRIETVIIFLLIVEGASQTLVVMIHAVISATFEMLLLLFLHLNNNI
jgi:hypothetical protein